MEMRAKRAETDFGAKHPYETLGVEPQASSGEIRKAYHKLSLLFHPDKNAGSEASVKAFRDISAAFDVIGDPERRAVFDDLGGNTGEAFYSEASYRAHGRTQEGNFYTGFILITALTEKLWEKRVGSNDDVWIVEYYAPWCGPCQQFVPVFKNIAHALQDDAGIEVGSVNCATERNFCMNTFGVTSYPTILAVNDKHGTRQEYHGVKTPDAVIAWARSISREWKFLFRGQRIASLATEDDFASVVLATTDFAIVAFLDGPDCSACMTAKTNLMRLSAGLRGFKNITIGLVDCSVEESKGLCASQGVPQPPFAPLVKGYPSGLKPPGTIGEALYNSNEMEPHLAMEVMEKLTRLILSDRVEASSMLSDGFIAGFEKNRKEHEEKDHPQQDYSEPPPQWNGPKPRKVSFQGHHGHNVKRQQLA